MGLLANYGFFRGKRGNEFLPPGGKDARNNGVRPQSRLGGAQMPVWSGFSCTLEGVITGLGRSAFVFFEGGFSGGVVRRF